MKKKYRFRKMWFVCENNKVINENTSMTNIYRLRENAESVAARWQRDQLSPDTINWLKVYKQFKAEGFYLVHESLYEEILKSFDKNALTLLKT